MKRVSRLLAKLFAQPHTRPLFAIAMFAALNAASAIAQEALIYRCTALDGTALFRDQPCNADSATREARQNREGQVIAAAAPPAENGAETAARYQRYLDVVAESRLRDQAADLAEASRLKARAELEVARAELRAATAPPLAARCGVTDATGDCADTGRDYFSVPGIGYPIFNGRSSGSPYPGRYRPPIAGPQAPARPIQQPRVVRNTRSEILSLAPER